MISTNYFKLLVLTPEDKESGAKTILSNANPELYGITDRPRDSGMFYQNYAGIVLQDGLTTEQFLSDEYKELREAAYKVCKSQVIITPTQNKLTPAVI